jgi:hypothetical protein
VSGWLAILLSLASLGGNPAPGERPTLKQCNQLTSPAQTKQCEKAAKAKPKKHTKAKAKPKPGKKDSPSTSPTHRSEPQSGGNDRDDPKATPTPAPTATPQPTATPAPTPPPVYPSRTGVDLTDTDDWSIRPSYRILAAGRIDFVTTNVGEDDHNLSVRGGGREYGRLDLAPGESDTLTLDLAAGSYTLYCSLTGHEDAGMRANISVR